MLLLLCLTHDFSDSPLILPGFSLAPNPAELLTNQLFIMNERNTSSHCTKEYSIAVLKVNVHGFLRPCQLFLQKIYWANTMVFLHWLYIFSFIKKLNPRLLPLKPILKHKEHYWPWQTHYWLYLCHTCMSFSPWENKIWPYFYVLPILWEPHMN